MKQTNPKILAIDTSCDDTAASVVQGRKVLSNIIASQAQLHKKYGGVFPTVAKQAHKENISPTISEALKRAKTNVSELAAVAVTVGPGLAPALEIGISYAKYFSQQHNLPLIPVNHIEGHALSPLAIRNSRNEETSDSDFDISDITFPTLIVVVSGGHTQFILMEKLGSYKIVGTTIDDAAGECLDKIGRLINLGYPAGATIEEFAKRGNETAIEFPLPMTSVKTYDMSFSGLKTFARNFVRKKTEDSELSKQDIYDFCASAQYAVVKHITYKLDKFLQDHKIAEIWLGGGVAQNMYLRRKLRETIAKHEQSQTKHKIKKVVFRTPFSEKLCMDNAAMIGLVANLKYKNNELISNKSQIENIERIPRWKIGAPLKSNK